jgi:hypothetical protein
MEDVIVPVALFAIIPATVWAVSAYRYKSHAETLKVLDTMASRGDTITPELVSTLGVRRRPKHADLRLGLVLLAIAAAMLFSAGLIPDDEPQIVLTAFASFPFLIGLVYIGLWFGVSRKSQN